MLRRKSKRGESIGLTSKTDTKIMDSCPKIARNEGRKTGKKLLLVITTTVQHAKKQMIKLSF
ncbi:hypothetical protein Peur_029692 [Populus x canadensis]